MKYILKILVILLLPTVVLAVPGSNRNLSDTSATSNEFQLEELLLEAETLTLQGHPIDARAKLQKALRLAPKDYRPHMMLGVYYLTEVGHFRLANQYLRRAEMFFLEKYADDTQPGGVRSDRWQEHAKLLYLLAESRLNLDNYQGALDTLDKFAKHYWDSWYPGTRAWILWKMGRTDEAIRVVQEGLLRGASPGKTYNILGILLSAKGNREMSLQAFGNAIRSEMALGSFGQVATPLNNSGEVYRELFLDNYAESAWVNALKFPDGCDHVLPSLNLAILYIDSLRLLAAERALENFESCFAANSLREDTEHKALLALAKGRVDLKSGRIDEALEHLDVAVKSTQWFGKIGTNENDLKFAALMANAEALRAKAETLRNRQFVSMTERITNYTKAKGMRIKAWWSAKRARDLAVDELSNIEDLWIRHTDAMLEYPTFGRTLAGYPIHALAKRLQAISKEDSRKISALYYELYFATSLIEHGNLRRAKETLLPVIINFRNVDRLALAEAKLQYLRILEKERSFWSEPDKENLNLRLEIFEIIPSNLRFHGFALPVTIRASEDSESDSFYDALIDSAFYPVKQSPYQLAILSGSGNSFTLQLSNADQNTILTTLTVDKEDMAKKDWKSKFVNDFIAKSFEHRVDPEYGPLVKLDILRKLGR